GFARKRVVLGGGGPRVWAPAASLPAISACSANRSGCRSTRSQTCRPIDPVAPSSARRRGDGRGDLISLVGVRGILPHQLKRVVNLSHAPDQLRRGAETSRNSTRPLRREAANQYGRARHRGPGSGGWHL